MSFPAGWQGADSLFLDCDSTLAAIEGVDELARRKGVDVAALTARAMNGELPLEAVYQARLAQIAPTRADLEWLGQRYLATAVEGAAEVIAACQQLGIHVHILSGGLRPAILPCARAWNIPESQVHAVPCSVPADGSAQTEAQLRKSVAHPLARDGGKPAVLSSLLDAEQARRALLVGDGASDLEAASSIGLFAGFGGVVTRAAVKQQAEVFLPGPGLYAVALLAAGPQRAAALRAVAPELAEQAARDFAALPSS